MISPKTQLRGGRGSVSANHHALNWSPKHLNSKHTKNSAEKVEHGNSKRAKPSPNEILYAFVTSTTVYDQTKLGSHCCLSFCCHTMKSSPDDFAFIESSVPVPPDPNPAPYEGQTTCLGASNSPRSLRHRDSRSSPSRAKVSTRSERSTLSKERAPPTSR